MAPTHTVEDGTGIAAANAYITAAEGDTYHDDYGEPVTWTGATDLSKELAIRLATQYLDASYVNRWRGFRSTADQGLDWPRVGVIDASDWSRDSDEVPMEIKDACAILALKSLEGETFLPDVVPSSKGIIGESVQVGPIKEAIKFAGTKSNFKKFSLVDGTLRPLLEQRNRRIRG